MSEKLRSRKALIIYGSVTLGVSLLCVVLRLLSMLFFFDTDIGYYESGALLPIISNFLPTAAVVWAFVLFAVPALHLSPNAPMDTRAPRLSAIPALVGFAGFSFVYIRSLIELSEFFGQIPRSYILAAICSVIALLFFIFKVIGRSGTAVSVISGIFTIVWIILALMESYFDTYVQMNSPMKLVFQFACLSALLLIVSEMRVGVDGTRKNLHLFSAAASTILLPFSAIPSLICLLLDKQPLTYTLAYYDAILLLLWVLSVARLAQMCFFKCPPALENVSENMTEEQDGESENESDESTAADNIDTEECE